MRKGGVTHWSASLDALVQMVAQSIAEANASLAQLERRAAQFDASDRPELFQPDGRLHFVLGESAESIPVALFHRAMEIFILALILTVPCYVTRKRVSPWTNDTVLSISFRRPNLWRKLFRTVKAVELVVVIQGAWAHASFQRLRVDHATPIASSLGLDWTFSLSPQQESQLQMLLDSEPTPFWRSFARKFFPWS